MTHILKDYPEENFWKPCSARLSAASPQSRFFRDKTDYPEFRDNQSFSIAGGRSGFKDARGTLIFEIARLVEAKRPAFLLLENVPGLLSHDKGRTYSTILATLNDLGYGIEWCVLNSKHFGVPQSRRRLFIVGYSDFRCAGKVFPLGGTGGKALVQVLGGPQGSRVYDPAGVACTQAAGAGGFGGKTGLYLVGVSREKGVRGVRDTALTLNACDYKGINRNQTGNAVFVDLTKGGAKQTEEARCLTARYAQATLSNHNAERSGVLLIKEATKTGYKEARPGDSVDLGYPGSNTRRGRVGRDIAHTLEATCIQGIIERGGRIRKLMPRECLRLQGFDEEKIDRLLAITSDSQAYKQAGNAVYLMIVIMWLSGIDMATSMTFSKKTLHNGFQIRFQRCYAMTTENGEPRNP